jgi:hypothetical protein
MDHAPGTTVIAQVQKIPISAGNVFISVRSKHSLFKKLCEPCPRESGMVTPT